MKTFLKKFVQKLKTWNPIVVRYCVGVLMASIIFLFIFGNQLGFLEPWLDSFRSDLLFVSILLGISILYSVYSLVADKDYINKKYIPITWMIISITFFLAILTIAKRAESTQKEFQEMKEKRGIENVCTKN